MKTLLGLAVVTMLGIVACSKDEGLTASTAAPTGPEPKKSAAASLDGTWKTKCLNPKEAPYIAKVVIQGNELYQSWTKYADDECKVLDGTPDFTPLFNFSLSAEAKDGLQDFDISWDQTIKGVHYTGKLYNSLAAADSGIKFYPFYQAAWDMVEGTTPEKRFVSFVNPTTNTEEEYVRE